jgi:hypothetical protein
LPQFAGAQVEFEKTKANRSRQIGIGHVQTPCGESSTAACLPYSIPQSGPGSPIPDTLIRSFLFLDAIAALAVCSAVMFAVLNGLVRLANRRSDQSS